jgi:hypothetical protein
MTDKVTLGSIASFQNDSTATVQYNLNNILLTGAIDNTLSRDGTTPNQMNANLDMNSNQIVNLPAPIAPTAPVRLEDLTTFQGGGTINAIPTGGNTGQALTKTSNTNYQVGWSNVPTGPVTSVSGDLATWNSTTGSAMADSGILATNVVTLAGSQTLTNKSIAGSQITGTVAGANMAAANLAAGNVNGGVNGTLPIANGGTGATSNTGTGSLVLATSPTLVTPTLGAATATSVTFSPTTGGIIGTTTNDNASAGTVGEYISSNVLTASAVSLITATAKTVTSISLTAGDWDVNGSVYYDNIAGSTVITQAVAAINTTTNALPSTPSGGGSNYWIGSITGNGPYIPTATLRLSLATTTTIYLIAYAAFTTSTANAYGLIRARRIR